jgi:ABC-2 type transport system permease protein
MGTFRLYWRYLGLSLRAQMQYPASFVMLVMGRFLITSIDILGIWALFTRFGSVRGWRLAEVAVFYGVVKTGFAVADAFSRGFDLFAGMVKSGDFDRLLLRPRATAMQVAGQELTLFRVGQLAQGLLVLFLGAAALDVAWTAPRVFLTVLAILGSACLFSGLIVLQATSAFWTTESLEVWSAVTYGGTETGQYPLSLYRPWFRKFFTFVVPLACVTYFPILVILGRRDEALGSPTWFGWVAPLTGVVFLVLSLRVWEFGVRHYRSTGS